jgi:hypothetical protein
LNRLVDAVYPESDVSRRFLLLVDQYVASGCKDPAPAAEIRSQLAEWATVDDRLQPLTQRSLLVREASPASAALSQAAKIALDALDAIGKGAPLSDDQKKKFTDSLSALELQAHKCQLTLPELAAFQKIVETASTIGVCANPK